MGVFTLSWFKSEKAKQLEQLQIKEQKLKNKLLKKHLKENLEVPSIKYADVIPEGDRQLALNLSDKPYSSVKLVNDILTIVLNDGSVIIKPQATQEDFVNVRKCSTEEGILVITAGKEVVEERRKEQKAYEKAVAINKGADSLKKYKDFDVKDNCVYLKGIDRTLPQLLVEKFLEVAGRVGGKEEALEKDEEYNSLKRFFMWCCLNPRAEVANDLYGFLVKNSFNITKQGFFVALRNVVNVAEGGESNELVHFISNSYNKIKAVWKKNPSEYEVFNDSGYVLVKSDKQNHGYNKHVGNLKDLYLDLPNMKENRFTDAHTHTFDIRVGKVVSMPKEDCNWSRADCAHAGLHFTSDEIHYVGCGDTSVLILINPMKVVGIGESKGRCYEYLPIMTVPRDEATEILHDLDFDTLELDEQYAIDELNDLENRVKEGFAVESKKHQFNIPQISSVQVNKIVKTLNEMKEEIKGRIKSV